VPDQFPNPVEAFLSSTPIAVVGASADPSKFGYRVLEAYLRHDYTAYPVNPTAGEILRRQAYPDLASLPEPPAAVSVITPPVVTEQVMPQIIASGARHVWLQPGAESPSAVRLAQAAGLNVLFGGPCVLVELARRG
jgi:predicted CoA-binding protein